MAPDYPGFGESEAKMHRPKAGHFAVEDHLDCIAGRIQRFCTEKVSTDKKMAMVTGK